MKEPSDSLYLSAGQHSKHNDHLDSFFSRSVSFSFDLLLSAHLKIRLPEDHHPIIEVHDRHQRVSVFTRHIVNSIENFRVKRSLSWGAQTYLYWTQQSHEISCSLPEKEWQQPWVLQPVSGLPGKIIVCYFGFAFRDDLRVDTSFVSL